MTVFLISILCRFSLAAVPMAPPSSPQVMALQVRNIQRIQIQQELTNLSSDIAQKLQEKSDLESQLNQLKAPLSAAKSFKLNSQIRRLSSTEAEMQNRLQQLNIDIKELKKKQTAMTAALAN